MGNTSESFCCLLEGWQAHVPVATYGKDPLPGESKSYFRFWTYCAEIRCRIHIWVSGFGCRTIRWVLKIPEGPSAGLGGHGAVPGGGGGPCGTAGRAADAPRARGTAGGGGVRELVGNEMLAENEMYNLLGLPSRGGGGLRVAKHTAPLRVNCNVSN